MLMWIFAVGVLVTAVVIGAIIAWDEVNVFFAVGPFFLVLFIGALLEFCVLLMLIPLTWGSMSYTTANTTHALKNVGDNSAVHGQFYRGIFVGYGTIDGNRTVNFVETFDGYSKLGQVDADKARIHEGTKSPRVIRHDYTWYNKGLVPWAISSSVDYDFYVPAGTISQDFAIGNGGANNG